MSLPVFKDRDRTALFITPQGPPARHDHLGAVRLGVREFALPSIRLQQLLPNFLERLRKNRVQQIPRSSANRLLSCESVEFFCSSIPVGDDRIHIPHEDGVVREVEQAGSLLDSDLELIPGPGEGLRRRAAELWRTT